MSSSYRLAAIMFSDLVGYTTLMGNSESAALDLLKKNRQLHNDILKKHQGQLLKEMGDGMMCSFESVSQAIEASVEIIYSCQDVDGLQLRIGIHLGEVVLQNNDIFGDGVNIASRLQDLAPPQGILVSEVVFNNIRNKDGYRTQFLGEKMLKNVDQPVKVYQLKTSAPQGSEFKASIENSLAVLPFVNMSNDPDQEYFCEGISEEIINTVVQVPEIKVAGRTSSFSFKGKNEDLRKMGSLLGVANILEGSVRKSGNRIRITAQLIEVNSGFHLWSNKYDRELDDIFQIQDEISLEIANHLQQAIIGEKSVPKLREQTQSIEAYDLYLKGRSLYYQRGDALWEALGCFKQALNIDPDYALALCGMAETYIMLSFYGYLHPEKSWANAIPAAKKAMQLGPGLGETYNALAIIALLHDRDLEITEKEFKKALQINPNHIQARTWYGLFYLVIATNNFTDGIRELEKAVETDPLSPYVIGLHAMALSMAGRHQEAIETTGRLMAMNPKSWISLFLYGLCLLRGGENEKSIEVHLKGLEMSDGHIWNLVQLVHAYVNLGQSDLANGYYQKMTAQYENQYLPPSALAMSAAKLGDVSRALKLSREAIDINDPFLFNITNNFWPPAEDLRKLPGFKEIIRNFRYGKPNAE